MTAKKEYEIIANVSRKAAQNGITASFVFHREKSHLMRIGNNSVSLNTSENLTRLDIEVIDGKKMGSHTQMGDIKTEEYVLKALEIATEKAKNSSQKDYQPIETVIEQSVHNSRQYDPNLENLDSAIKAQAYENIMKSVSNDYNYSGSWSSGSTELFMVSTANEKQVSHFGTDQDFNIVLKHPEKKWELRQKQTGWRKNDFDENKVIQDFHDLIPYYEKIEPYKPEPGSYTVAFGAEAIGEIIMMASYLGFSAQAWEEKQGWTSNNTIGDKILGDNFSLSDNPQSDQTYGFEFDFAGLVRKPFKLVENGVFKNLMYDNFTAAKYNKQQTGHTLNSISLCMLPGNSSQDLLKETEGMGKVLYIPALHYLNLPNYSQGIFTGSSRFNALLIEDGKIKGPIFSSRVTDNFKNVFSNMVKISAQTNSVNLSSTYDRRSPEAASVPSYIIVENVKITDSSDSF